MKKFLLLFLTMFITVSTYASIDTVFVKPNEAISFELKVDTAKYPILKDNKDKVTWVYSNGKEFSKVQEEYITKLSDGSVFYNVEPINNSTLIGYAFKVGLTRSAFEGYTIDTLKYIHVYGEPKLTEHLINGIENDITIKEGDSINVHLKTNTPLDITNVEVIEADSVVYKGTDLDFKFALKGFGKKSFTIKAFNPSKQSVQTKNVTILPRLIDNPSEYVIVSKDSELKKIGSELYLNNEDSVSLIVHVNADQFKDLGDIKYVWNKNGYNLPEGLKIKQDSILIIPHFNKPLEGSYNCIVTTPLESKTISFNLNLSDLTSNEQINGIKLGTCNNQLTIKNANNKNISVYNTLGILVFNKLINSDYFTIPLNAGIYFVKVNNNTYKVLVK